jgi:hypothetical protein
MLRSKRIFCSVCARLGNTNDSQPRVYRSRRHRHLDRTQSNFDRKRRSDGELRWPGTGTRFFIRLRFGLLHDGRFWKLTFFIRLRFGLSHDGRAYRPNLPGNFVSFGIDRITMKLNRVRRRCRDVSRCLCSMLLFLLIRTWMQVKVSIYLSP